MPYNRTAALDYARYYWNRVCHDGKIGSNWEGSIRAAKRDQGIHATFGHAAPGTIINDQSAAISLPPSQVEDDCTHFVSCCIGYSGPNAPIGGVPVTGHGRLRPHTVIRHRALDIIEDRSALTACSSRTAQIAASRARKSPRLRASS
jgi:hypothetical protein